MACSEVVGCCCVATIVCPLVGTPAKSASFSHTPMHAMKWLSSSAREIIEILGRRQILHGLRQLARLGKHFAQH